MRIVTPPPIQRACAPCMASKGAKAAIACSLVPLPRNDIVFVHATECTQQRPLKRRKREEKWRGIVDEDLTHTPPAIQRVGSNFPWLEGRGRRGGGISFLPFYPQPQILILGVFPPFFLSPSEKRRGDGKAQSKAKRDAETGTGYRSRGFPFFPSPFSFFFEVRARTYYWVQAYLPR